MNDLISKSAGIIAAMLRGGPLVCDTPPALTDFAPEQFMGTWHKISHNGGVLNPTLVVCEIDEFAAYDSTANTAMLYQSNQGMASMRIGREGFIRFEEDG